MVGSFAEASRTKAVLADGLRVGDAVEEGCFVRAKARTLQIMILFRHATHAPRGYPGRALSKPGFAPQARLLHAMLSRRRPGRLPIASGLRG